MKLWQEVILIFIVWYTSSCIATTSTKVILKRNILETQELLIIQLLLSVMYLKLFQAAGIFNLTISSKHVQNLKLHFLTMSTVYVIGFLLLQTALQMVSVSFAVTARGAEPAITCFFGLVFLSENITNIQWIAVLLIAVGISFCTGSDKSWTVPGLLVLVICDICFSTRSLIVKFMHKRTNDLNLERLSGQKIYYVTCIIGSALMIAFSFGKFLVVGTTSTSTAIQHYSIQIKNNLPILAANSACFLLYNASSYILLGKIQLSYHAIGNSVRQVFVISFSMIVFQGSTLTPGNIFGIICVACGAACYSIFKKDGAWYGIKRGQ